MIADTLTSISSSDLHPERSRFGGDFMGPDHQNKMMTRVFNPLHFKTNGKITPGRSRNVGRMAVMGIKM